jgi:hypothetical protein
LAVQSATPGGRWEGGAAPAAAAAARCALFAGDGKWPLPAPTWQRKKGGSPLTSPRRPRALRLRALPHPPINVHCHPQELNDTVAFLREQLAAQQARAVGGAAAAEPPAAAAAGPRLKRKAQAPGAAAADAVSWCSSATSGTEVSGWTYSAEEAAASGGR